MRTHGREREARRSWPTVMGLPIPLIAVALVLSASIGLMLATSLRSATEGRGTETNVSIDSDSGPGKNAAGLPVISESTLGIEVRRFVSDGLVQTPASFDVAACQAEQGIDEDALAMEEVEWSEDGTGTVGWLIVHGAVDVDTLRANGGAISVTVVESDCGTDPDADPAENRLWSGTTMIGVE